MILYMAGASGCPQFHSPGSRLCAWKAECDINVVGDCDRRVDLRLLQLSASVSPRSLLDAESIPEDRNLLVQIWVQITKRVRTSDSSNYSCCTTPLWLLQLQLVTGSKLDPYE